MFALPRTAVRFLNVCVALIVALLAAQLLFIGFESEPLVSAQTLDSTTSWVERRPLAGAGILTGIGGVALGVAGLIGSLLPQKRTPASVTTRRQDGWTKLDRSSLEAAIERDLGALDPQTAVTTRVHRSGRVDIDIDTIDVAADGTAVDVRNAFEELVEQRHLPCRAGTIAVRPSRSRRRSRVVR